MARPLVVRVGDLPREPGSRRDFDCSVELEPLSTSSASTIPGMVIDVAGHAMGMAGGVEVVGTVRFDWYGSCRRCLEDVTGGITVEFREIAQTSPVDDDILPIEDDLLDLDPLVRELVLANLPLAPLCSEDCAGPDPERFPTLTERELEAEQPATDPRWAGLADLKFD